MIEVFVGRTADDVWQKAATRFRSAADDIKIREQGSQRGETVELLHAGFFIEDPRQRWVVSRSPALNPAFALAEVVWILCGRQDAAFLNYWNSKLPQYAGGGETYHGAYGHRIRRRFDIDQIERAYHVLSADSTSRQVVLQIWDPATDLPIEDGTPRSKDIPCNISSLLKVRDDKLEWMQIIRSNDLFLGLPHNMVQFTYLQEVMAGWLGVDVGGYYQISDSLHVYSDDMEKIANSSSLEAAKNGDVIRLAFEDSEHYLRELANRIEIYVQEELSEDQHLKSSQWTGAPVAIQNMLSVISAEAARRRGWPNRATFIIEHCTNPVFIQLWKRWMERVQ